MKSKTSVIAAAIAASGLAFAANGFAATPNHLPPMHMKGDISYLTGGIGKSEASAMKHVARRYPLELEFVAKAKPRDEYLANIKVKIKNAHDKLVLDTTAEGPFMLAKMPAGKYTVSAEHNGKMEHRTIEIAPKMHKRVVFVWKS